MTTDTRRYVLYFDTSVTGAGALVSQYGNTFTVHQVEQFKYGTPKGDLALSRLFDAAKAVGASVGAEEPQGRDRRGTAIRRSTHGWLMVLKERARHEGLPWGGSVHPGTAKKALTGDGAANKQKMITYANLRFGLDLQFPKEEHAADAIAGGIACLEGRTLTHGKGPKLPATIEQAVKKAGGRRKKTDLPDYALFME